MKQLVIFINILLGLIWWGCDSQPIPSPSNSSIGNIQTRGIITASSLPTGSKALFNASGGIALTNAVFSFDGTQWESSGEPLTLDSSKETSLTAIYPAKNDETTLITQNPYVENALEDVLIAQHTSTGQTNIELEFKHLFAMLTINVASSMNASLTEIAIEVPRVTSINGVNGTFSTSGTHTTTLSRNNDGIYSFIIPPLNDCPLSIIFNPGEGQLSHTLTHNFESGYKYECNVVGTDTRPGIKTAEELIAFSYLINGKEPPKDYQGYSLEDFGETVNNRTVYRLLADIDMANAPTQLLLPIGLDENTAFKNIFDGEEHTIYNLIIPDNSINEYVDEDFSGLFGCLDKDGIVKNLDLHNAQTADTPNCTRIGGIVSKNYGTIDNCSVEESTFKAISKTGGICGLLTTTGYIINSYSTNNTFYLKNGYISGGIAGDANGRILNCYSYNNSFKNTVSGSYSGGIAGQSTSGRIYNCYLYQKSIPNYWGALLGINSNTQILNFLFNKCSYVTYSPKKTSLNYAQQFDTYFKVESTHISTLLNEWITTTGKAYYPDITFNKWKAANDGSACFQ